MLSHCFLQSLAHVLEIGKTKPRGYLPACTLPHFALYTAWQGLADTLGKGPQANASGPAGTAGSVATTHISVEGQQPLRRPMKTQVWQCPGDSQCTSMSGSLVWSADRSLAHSGPHAES